ncbi:MAG TPA: glycosyl hydrolase family 79 C-terminal domain-containing protein [Verrucomicrobiae bacterium]|nr:glycosyl hydrolase family 79 C-terminal domain-containing protein [Verrucomicrobiae bacterium]
MTRRRFIASALASTALARFSILAQEAAGKVRLSLGDAASRTVPLDYLGFSYETTELSNPAFFAADNQELVSLFRGLSPQGVLRLGGNSSEFCWWHETSADHPPELPASAHGDTNWMPHKFVAIEPAAIDHLKEFLDATGWNAIYGLNLGTGTPEGDAAEAAYVARRLGPRLLYFQIGNEPDLYRNPSNGLRPRDWTFDTYLAQWLAFARAVLARVPSARFGGPDVASNPDWVVQFAQQAPKELPGKIVACTGHYYAEGPPDSPRTTIARLLAADPRVAREVPRCIHAAEQAGLVYRMAEGNSCYRGGKPGLSNAFCSALWAADYLLELASFGCVGVNLHGGGARQIRLALGGHLPGEQLAPGAAGLAAQGSFYTPIAGNRENGFSARPVFYGMKLAGLFAGGRMRPVHLDGSAVNGSAWAAEMPGGATRLVLINKDPQQRLDISIRTTDAARVWKLEASALTATSDVTLAGAQFKPETAWQPEREEDLSSKDGEVQLPLEPASAAALFFPGSI